MTEHLDVVIVGAGISGVSAAWHLQDRCPTKSYAILEKRAAMGGTWDLFRYPGIRSDSDMYTLGFRFRPWTERQAIADGGPILDYVKSTAAMYGIDKHIRLNHKVVGADWSNTDNRWTVQVENNGTPSTTHLLIPVPVQWLLQLRAGLRADVRRLGGLHRPDHPSAALAGGPRLRRQEHRRDRQRRHRGHSDSGAGEFGRQARHDAAALTDLHRLSAEAGQDGRAAQPLAARQHGLLRGPMEERRCGSRRCTGHARSFRSGCERSCWATLSASCPRAMTWRSTSVRSYNPWDQRLCLVPSGDLFRAIRKGKADVVTDTIDRFTATGIRLNSGEELPADIIITATGLNLQLFGGATVTVDGQPVDLTKTMAYKGMMLSGLPNMVYTVGYTNASWTLKADLVSEFACRLLNYMDDNGFDTVVVEHPGSTVEERPFMDFTPGYVLRSLDELPKQGSRTPWRLNQNYLRDIRLIRRGKIDDEGLRFAKKPAAVAV